MLSYKFRWCNVLINFRYGFLILRGLGGIAGAMSELCPPKISRLVLISIKAIPSG